MILPIDAIPQAAQRGQKAAAPTQPDADDPLKDKYGDMILVQSQGQSSRTWTQLSELSPAREGMVVGRGGAGGRCPGADL